MSFSTDRLKEIQETIWEPFDEYESDTRATQEQLKTQRLIKCTYPVDKMLLEEVWEECRLRLKIESKGVV